MNRINVIGRVSQDVTTNQVNGRNVANFNIAAQNTNKTGTENGRAIYGTNFYRVSAWGQAADVAARFLKKGHRVAVYGDLVIRDYTGNDGIKHTSVEINNAGIELIETKAEAEAKQNAVAAAAAPATTQPQQNPGFTPVEFDNGLPF